VQYLLAGGGVEAAGSQARGGGALGGHAAQDGAGGASDARGRHRRQPAAPEVSGAEGVGEGGRGRVRRVVGTPQGCPGGRGRRRHPRPHAAGLREPAEAAAQRVQHGAADARAHQQLSGGDKDKGEELD